MDSDIHPNHTHHTGPRQRGTSLLHKTFASTTNFDLDQLQGLSHPARKSALVDLHEVTEPAEFTRRLAALRREHGRKVTFVERLGHAGL